MNREHPRPASDKKSAGGEFGNRPPAPNKATNVGSYNFSHKLSRPRSYKPTTPGYTRPVPISDLGLSSLEQLLRCTAQPDFPEVESHVAEGSFEVECLLL